MVALTVLAFIFGFILLDLAIQYYNKGRAAQLPAMIASHVEDLLSDFLMPLGYFFHPGHTWARIKENGEITIGPDDFVQKSLGKIDSVSLPKVGQVLNANAPAFELLQSGKKVTFNAPISGTVIAVNDQLKDAPNGINGQPYESGWIARIQPSAAATELKALMIADSANQWLKKEIAALRNFLADIAGQKSELGVTLADGGVPINGVLQGFGESEWGKFQAQFLNNQGQESTV
jgi:glycine cleavage system H lipoate-binding protein